MVGRGTQSKQSHSGPENSGNVMRYHKRKLTSVNSGGNDTYRELRVADVPNSKTGPRFFVVLFFVVLDDSFRLVEHRLRTSNSYSGVLVWISFKICRFVAQVSVVMMITFFISKRKYL